MVRLLCRLEGWLRRNLTSIKNGACRQRNSHARAKPSNREVAPPPPYSRSSPSNAESLETLRVRNPSTAPRFHGRRPYTAPPGSMLPEACEVAANNAAYDTYTALFEDNREMTAAAAIRAIADAVSASPSYAAFVAAVTMAESLALISAEEVYGEVRREFFLRRCGSAMDAAIAAAEAAGTASNGCAWPCNTHRVGVAESQVDSSDSSDSSDSDNSDDSIKSPAKH